MSPGFGFRRVDAASRWTAGILPGAGGVQEGFDFGEGGVVEGPAVAGGGQHVPPGAEGVQAEAMGGEFRLRIGEDAVGEDHGGVGAGGPGFADGVDERKFRAAVGGEVFDEEDALAFGHRAFDAGIATVALGFLRM